MKKIIVLALKMYRKYISPNVGQSCRFYPSCSEYAIEAIDRYGVVRGIVCAMIRILRCNPFSKGGYDPA